MSEFEIRNAKITATMLGREDRGIFTFYLSLDYGSAGQGFGGYILDKPRERPEFGRAGTSFGCEAILSVLDILEVNKWEKLVGTSIRVEASHEKIKRIGHYLKNRWVDLEKLGKEYREKEGLKE